MRDELINLEAEKTSELIEGQLIIRHPEIEYGFKLGAMWADTHRWIKVQDYLPKLYQPVLLFSFKSGMYIGYKVNDEVWTLSNEENKNINDFTHWLEIPDIE